MARCPFALYREITGSVGAFTEGPFKIVHHTTEGSTAAGAFDAFRENRSDPHFTVDDTAIYQHVDTDEAARALKNPDGGVETNRDGAIQIEVVGFAHLAKPTPTLRNVARLCRWIESVHAIPREWPNGYPKVAVNGRDPGGHNRNAQTWDAKGGHYGHCHVPENDHWDPGYTRDEVEYLMQAEFDEAPAFEPSFRTRSLEEALPGIDRTTLDGAESTMPDHAVVSTKP